ncbi:MAG: aromatic amino acid transport family protein [Candidatus Omnitrophota bacterium]
MNKKIPFTIVVSIVFLIAGNLVGAGTLGLPTKTGLAGFVPAVIGLFVMGTAMFFTAMVLTREVTRKGDTIFNYPSFYHRHLGLTGKWVAILTNLLILYGLLTVYLSGAATIITNLLHPKISNAMIMVIFFAIMTTINLTGMSIAEKYNSLLVILMLGVFLAMFGMAEVHVDPKRFAFADWKFLPATIPIILTTYNFHTIIPIVCEALDWRERLVRRVILSAMIIGFLLSVMWIQVGLGALPLGGTDNSIATAFNNNLPATVPLAQTIKAPIFITLAMLFALFAIATSYIANGTGLMAFVEDLSINHLKLCKTPNRVLIGALSFAPPFIIALVYPNLFMSALDLVGGFGIVILFGLLPSIILVKRAKSLSKRLLGIVLVVVFLFCLVLETCQELGVLPIKPDVEYWKYNFTHR